MTVKTRKKLVEVALPLEAVNKEALHRKQKAPKGWPATFHKWWSQKPLAVARAILFAQLVDDPSANPDLFPTEKDQEKERDRLFALIGDLVLWDNTNNKAVLERARAEIWKSWQRSCDDNVSHPYAEKFFGGSNLPAFADPFSGSGALPLSAQWLGLESHASDLNPVSVLINKALIEIPPKFSDRSPINPAWRDQSEGQKALTVWRGAQGLADDVRYYGQWMRDKAISQIGHLYPKVVVTSEMVSQRPDLKALIGQELTVTAWIWARTIKSPNPAFANVDVPLTSTFLLSSKVGKEVYIDPVINGDGYYFTVKVGKPRDIDVIKLGTSAGKRGAFKCLMSGVPITYDYIRSEGQAGRMRSQLMAVVAEGARGRVYLSPTAEQEEAAKNASPPWRPELALPDNPRDFKTPNYGLTTFGDLFTARQLVSLETFSALVGEAIEEVRRDAVQSGLPKDDRSLRDGGIGSVAYAEAIGVYLACVVDRMAYYGSSLSTWLPKDNALRDCMPRQALAMSWEFAEANPIGKSSGDISTCVAAVSNYLDVATPYALAFANQTAAQTLSAPDKCIISADPPYYDNIGYADLSDFFYVWLRNSLRSVYPDLFGTLAVPKAEELVATPYRHGSKENAEAFFLTGMTEVMHRLAEQTHPAYPVTIYYAFKQAETEGDAGTSSTGWETFLDAIIRAGFAITGTWPLRTEGSGRLLANETNALASSIVLVCRPRDMAAPSATRREFVAALKAELPRALRHLQAGNIAPVDLAQAAIGPGMAVYTRYAKVLDAEGKPVSVRDALALINATLDEALAEQEGDFDADSRWALAWFEQNGFAEGEYGVAETLSKAKNTSVTGLATSGILESKRGKVRLLKPEELPANWDPATDPRLTSWEVVHHLIRVLGSGGESAAADLVAKLGARAETARELAYRLYTICERKKRAAEALAYNGLVQSWPEIVRLAQEGGKPATAELDLFNAGER